jgi:hypothetical protein
MIAPFRIAVAEPVLDDPLGRREANVRAQKD